MLKRDRAAAFCGLTIRKFNRAISESILPKPVCIAGENLWHVEQLRDSLDRLAGWQAQSPSGDIASQRVQQWRRSKCRTSQGA